MSKQSRHKQHTQSPLRPFYFILAIVGVVGAVALAAIALNNRQPIEVAPAGPLTAPVGQTDDGQYYKGRPDAPVTVTEYSDFQCPGCAFFALRMSPAITRDYIETGKVRLIYHDYPLNKHANAIPAAEASRCAGDQQAFWPMHDLLFANQEQWAESIVPNQLFAAYAAQLKLNRATFEQCMNDHTHRAAILRARDEGDRIRIAFTPTFEINGRQLDATQLKAAIDAALAAGKQP